MLVEGGLFTKYSYIILSSKTMFLLCGWYRLGYDIKALYRQPSEGARDGRREDVPGGRFGGFLRGRLRGRAQQDPRKRAVHDPVSTLSGVMNCLPYPFFSSW